jgi:hypothetical protein
MNELYGRKIELIVGGKLHVNQLGSGGLTINFEVTFDDDKEPNICSVRVYNLSDSTIAGIKKDTPLVLNAGYIGDVGSILLGFVDKIATERQGVDKITEIQVIDGATAWYSLPIKKTYKAGTKASTILRDLHTLSGLEIGAFALPVDKIYTRGKTIATTVSNALSGVANDCGAKAHVTRGKTFIRPKNEGQAIGFVLDKDHGLIGSPTPITTEKNIPIPKAKDKKLVRDGYKVVMLLNHRITTDAIIKITSKTANGMFRVESGRHYSDGQSFYTETEVYPV